MSIAKHNFPLQWFHLLTFDIINVIIQFSRIRLPKYDLHRILNLIYINDRLIVDKD
jgi:hypothetical protein